MRVGVKAGGRSVSQRAGQRAGQQDRDDQVYGIINGSVDVNARRGQEAGVSFVLRKARDTAGAGAC